MKKTIFGFVCAILMSCTFASCDGKANADKAFASDSTEVVDSVSADSTAVDSAAVDSVA